MLATVAVTVATHDLSAGVAVGVLLSGVFFAFKVTRLMAVQVGYDPETDTRLYTVSGQVFFASAEVFADRGDVPQVGAGQVDAGVPRRVAKVEAVGALEDVASTMRRHGMSVEVIGLNEASAILMDRHAPLMRDVKA
jgi:SulP family sulfate permease